MSSAETTESADTAARVCAWADGLARSGRIDEARQVLQASLDPSGDSVAVALRLAELEAQAGASARAAELLNKILAVRPGHLPASRLLAGLLLAEGRADEAARVVSGAAGQPAEYGELAGQIWRAQGRHAAAVRAFDACPSLSPQGRRSRRRSWWLSGGPFRRRGRDVRLPGVPDSQAPAPLAEPSDELLEVLTWAMWLSARDRPDDARQVMADALAVHGRHPRLLRCAAEIEDAANAPNTALYLWREAYKEAPEDVDITCGLALQLAGTTVSAPVVFRVGEAIQVLDDFPDQSHPKIRSARAFALGYIDAGAARTVTAYGPAEGLVGHDARRRLRLWWRSAGPAGQLWVLVTSRIRRVHRAAEQSEPVPRTEAESEAIARVLDSVQGEPPATLRERIEEAWRQHGRRPSLLLAHAEADEDEGDYWHCLALAVEALRISPGSLDATCRLAGAVYNRVGYGTALRVIAGLSKAARGTTEARVTLGDLHRQSRNFALATAAYGDPRDLGRYDRRLRRQCVRRGLLRRLSSSTSDRAEAVDLGWFDVVSPDVAKVLDKCSSLRDQPAKARETVNNALDHHGRHPLLLIELAGTELDDLHAGAALAAEAIRSAPANPLVADAGIRELWLSDHDPEAFITINGLPDHVRSSADVGAGVSRVYVHWRLRGHAVEAFGERGLVARLWRERRKCWWRSGGPFTRIRRSVMAQEDALISALKEPERQSITLSALPLAAPVAAAVRADLALC